MRFILLVVFSGGIASAHAGEMDDGPAYLSPVLFVSNLMGGTKDGYITIMNRREDAFRCGREPNQIKVSWKFLKRTPKGDLYEFAENSSGDRRLKEVLYNDAPLEIWKVYDRTVIIKPNTRQR